MSPTKDRRPADGAAEDPGNVRTLLPMLLGGLILIVVGAGVIMTFV